MSPGDVLANRIRCSNASGFCVGCSLSPCWFRSRSAPGAQRDEPVAAHLHVIVQGLHGLVVEPVAAIPAPCRPDHRLMRIGEPTPTEVRHRIGLAPHDVVEDPKAEILQDRADAEDVVVGADYPDRAVLAQHAPAFAQPLPRERVIGGEILELVPVVIHGVDQAIVRPTQLPPQLEVVGRIGEDAVHRRRRQHAHQRDAVPEHHLVQRQFSDDFHAAGLC